MYSILIKLSEGDVLQVNLKIMTIGNKDHVCAIKVAGFQFGSCYIFYH